MMERFLAALQFLTTIPVTLPRALPLSQAAPAFPLVGAGLGLAVGLTLQTLQRSLGNSLGALLAVTVLLLLTGGLHEDGLADVADAIRAGRSLETMQRILKDSRIGAYGALALALSLLLRWQALARLHASALPLLVAGYVLSRTALVALAGTAPALGTGLGASFVNSLSRRLLWAAVCIGLVISLACTVSAGMAALGVVLIAATATVVVALRWYFLRRLGGVNGDCLGAVCQVSEILNLLVLAWQPST